MEYRKLISFGKSSFVVTMPKSWVIQNKLKKGDLVYLEGKDNDLILSPRKENENIEEKSITILVDGKSLRRIQREIISAYIKDYKTITLQGEELKDKAKEVQDIIQNLMALEVLDQTSKKIVAKDFLDMKTISLFNLVRKIDVILRAMMEDCEKMFSEDNCDSINHRDSDLNRISFLIFRAVEYGLDHSSFIYKKYNLQTKDLLNIWRFVFNLEAVGDGVKRIARFMKEVKLDHKQKEKFLKILREAKLGYLRALKGFYDHEPELAHAVLETKTQFINECDQFCIENKKVENLGLMMEKVKFMVMNIHHLSRVVYQSDFTPK